MRSARTRKAAPPIIDSGRTTAVARPGHQADGVGHDDADEADQAAHRDRGRRAQRRRDHDDEADPTGVDPQGVGLLLADPEHVEQPAVQQQHDRAHDRVGQHQPDVATRRRAVRRPRIQE